MITHLHVFVGVQLLLQINMQGVTILNGIDDVAQFRSIRLTLDYGKVSVSPDTSQAHI